MGDDMTQALPTNPRETTLETLQAMKRERLKLGLSLEQVAAKAGVSPGLLRRLEAGELDQIGNAEIIQSAARAYGAFLQTKQTCEAKPAMTVASQATAQARGQASSRPNRRRTLALSLLVVGALAVAVALFLWRNPPLEERPQGAIMGNLSLGREFANDSSRQLADNTLQTPQHSDQEQQLPKEERPQSSAAAAASVDSYAEPSAAAAAEKEQRMLATRSHHLSPQHAMAELPQPSSGNQPAPAESRSEAGHTLELEATAECWIEVRIDDLKPQRELLNPGEQRTYSVNQKAGLIIGNAGGVRIKWDGQLLSPAGKPGKVIRLTLPHNL